MISGMGIYRQLIPLAASDEQRGRAMLELAELYADLREAADDVIVAVDVTPDGDAFMFAWPDREPSSAAA